MDKARLHRLVGWGLAFLAVVSVSVAAVEAYTVGYPMPLSLVTALLMVGTAIAWPFVGAEETGRGLPTCRECGHPAWGFSEFHFCIHCGSTRVHGTA